MNYPTKEESGKILISDYHPSEVKYISFKANELLRRFVTAIEIEASTDSVIKEAKEYLEITDYFDAPIMVEDYGKIEQAKNEAFREAISNSPMPDINYDNIRTEERIMGLPIEKLKDFLNKI